MSAKMEALLAKKFLGRELRAWLSHSGLQAVLAGALFAWVFAPVLSFMALGDDLTFVFSNEVIQKGLNPLLFWTRGHPHTKAWPAFYTLVWFLHRLASDPLLLDHLASLLLHFANGFLLIRIAARLRLRHAWAAGPLVWFHPAHLLTVCQIMLMTKILSGFAFLLWLDARIAATGARERPAAYARRFLSFCLSLFSSGQSYLFALLEWREYAKQHRLFAALKLAGPFLLASAYGGSLAATGVIVVEKMVVENLRASYGEVAPYRAIIPESRRVSEKFLSVADPANPAVAAAEQSRPEYSGAWSWAWDYFSSVIGLESAVGEVPWVKKVRDVGVTSLYYAQLFFVPLKLWQGARVAEFGPLANGAFFLVGLLVLGFVAYAFYRGNLLWGAVLLAYVPVSGIFFVPFTNHIDLVSARYAYLPFLPAILLALGWFNARPRWSALLFLWLAGLVLLTALESRTPGIYRLTNPN